MAPYQTSVNLRDDCQDNLGQDIIEVQILPQIDENWGDNTTAITGNTSEQSESVEDVRHWTENGSRSTYISCYKYSGVAIASLIGFTAIISPIAMVIFPKLGIFPDILSVFTTQQKIHLTSCNIECKGQLLEMTFKLIMLGIGSWAIFWKQRAIPLPRLCMFRTGVKIFTFLCTCTFWVFYAVQVTEVAKSAANGEVTEYKNLVAYAVSLTDCLLLVHYIAVLLMEIRHLQPTYCIKVIRTPDGESLSFAVGQLSIQRAAISTLEKYYTEFSIYNPYLERLPISKFGKKQSSNSFKFYDVEGNVCNRYTQQTQHKENENDGDCENIISHARRKDSSHNERFYEEHEFDRRVRKRRARLITAAEEAFAHIRRLHAETEHMSNIGLMNPMEAAQAVFPSMARALQKYLRATRQQPQHTVETILMRLARCLAQDATPRAFLEPFFSTKPVLLNEKERQRQNHHWALICEGELPSRPLTNGCEFQLRQGEIALLCTAYKIPDFQMTEQLADPKTNKFLLTFNSETSV